MKNTIVLAWNCYHFCIRCETEKPTFMGYMFPDQLPHQTLGNKAGRKGGKGFWIKEAQKRAMEIYLGKKSWKITMTKTQNINYLI